MNGKSLTEEEQKLGYSNLQRLQLWKCSHLLHLVSTRPLQDRHVTNVYKNTKTTKRIMKYDGRGSWEDKRKVKLGCTIMNARDSWGFEKRPCARVKSEGMMPGDILTPIILALRTSFRKGEPAEPRLKNLNNGGCRYLGAQIYTGRKIMQIQSILKEL